MTKPFHILQNLIGMPDIIATHINNLSFDNCRIGTYRYQWKVFFSKFVNLQRLSLRSCSINDGAPILDSFQALPSLRDLDLSHNSLKSISMTFVSSLPESLALLSLEASGISGFHIPYFTDILPNLCWLDLSNLSDLKHINCHNFTKPGFELDILNTCLDRLLRRRLIEQSRKIGFMVMDFSSHDEYSEIGSETEYYQDWSN